MIHTKQENLDKLKELVTMSDRLAEAAQEDKGAEPVLKHQADLLRQVCFEANYALQDLSEE